MGNKANPVSFRLAVNKDWKSRWFAKSNSDFAKNIIEDSNIRKLITDKMGPQAGISEIIIEKGLGRLEILIKSARPGIIIGKGGKQLESLRKSLEKLLKNKKFKIEIIEVKKPDLDAMVVAQQIGMQISKRMPFRRAVKQAVQRVMEAGAKGVMIRVAGRLGGVEISRAETYKQGSIPLSTLRNDISFGVYHAPTTYGTIGVKVWINQGERQA
jgi:small subunit ribosomal protein S3